MTEEFGDLFGGDAGPKTRDAAGRREGLKKPRDAGAESLAADSPAAEQASGAGPAGRRRLASYPESTRIAVIRRVVSDGAALTKAGEEYGVPKGTVVWWLVEFNRRLLSGEMSAAGAGSRYGIGEEIISRRLMELEKKQGAKKRRQDEKSLFLFQDKPADSAEKPLGPGAKPSAAGDAGNGEKHQAAEPFGSKENAGGAAFPEKPAEDPAKFRQPAHERREAALMTNSEERTNWGNGAGWTASAAAPAPELCARPASKPRPLSVSEVARMLKGALSGIGRISVAGELASFTRHPSGHRYFDIKDSGAVIHCAMFRSAAKGLSFEPRVGDKVELRCRVDFYNRDGRTQLVVAEMKKSGLGALYEAYLALKSRLEAEGLFSAEKKRPLPRVPRVIGVVTSLKAAGLRDVIRTLGIRSPYARIIVYPTPVQGAAAPAGIVRALEAAGARRGIDKTDVLLLVRGGGSFEDFACFNTEEVVRAVRASPVPVVTGIGHESDTTLADLAADLRAATPTAAAERCAGSVADLKKEIEAISLRLSKAAQSAIDNFGMRVDLAESGLKARDPRKTVKDGWERLARHESSLGASLRLSAAKSASRLDKALSRMRDAAKEKGAGAERVLSELERRLAASSPLVTASRSSRLSSLENRLCGLRPRPAELFSRVEVLRGRIGSRANALFAEKKARFERAETKLRSLEVNRQLARGYALVLASDRSIVRSAASLSPGDELSLLLSDGEARVSVLSTRPGGEVR